MELTKGWCKWYVSETMIIDAIKQLESNNVDMSKVFIVPAQDKEMAGKYYLIIYKNE